MTDISTDRLVLQAADLAQMRRILNRQPGPDDAWAPDYPFEGDIAGLTGMLTKSEGRDPRPFGYYRISRREDGLAIGGIGFNVTTPDGVTEVGYGLVPSARGHGYASEALSAMLVLARGLGITMVRADTSPDNVASQRTLVRAGFERVRVDEQGHYFEVLLTG